MARTQRCVGCFLLSLWNWFERMLMQQIHKCFGHSLFYSDAFCLCLWFALPFICVPVCCFGEGGGGGGGFSYTCVKCACSSFSLTRIPRACFFFNIWSECGTVVQMDIDVDMGKLTVYALTIICVQCALYIYIYIYICFSLTQTNILYEFMHSLSYVCSVNIYIYTIIYIYLL